MQKPTQPQFDGDVDLRFATAPFLGTIFWFRTVSQTVLFAQFRFLKTILARAQLISQQTAAPFSKHSLTLPDGNASLGSAEVGAALSNVYFGVLPCGRGKRRGVRVAAQLRPLGRR